MKNLKRALSLALASVMVLGMMVVGAGAVEFNDADKIENTDAVNTMVALGILKGKDNGSFDPEGIVTRAEMAKMICVALNGGKDPNLVGGTRFPDTKTHWAGGYIDYCANMGIVSGDTAGNFNPDNTVTGTEAAKMILIALGYTAENEKFINDAAWATNINVRASQKSLYEDVAINPSAGLTRDNAAQMIFNGIQADMVEYDYKVGAENGNVVSIAIAKDIKNETILSEKFGTYDESPVGVMNSITYNSDKEKWTYSITGQPSFTTDKDFTALMGMNVKVIAKQSDKTVYGIFAEDSSVLVDGFAGDITRPAVSEDSLEVAGDDYDLTRTAGNTPVIANMTGTELGKLSTASALAGTYSYKLIDHTDDGKADVLVVTPFTVEKVTYVGRDSLTLNGTGAVDFEDINAYEGIAKDDRVMVTAAANATDKTLTVVESETENATVTGTKNGKFMVDGVWMTNSSGTEIAVNDTIDYVAYGSVLYYAKVTGGEQYSKDIALVISAASTGSTVTAKNEAKLIFTDGSKKTVVTDKNYDTTPDLVGKLVTYYINNDDEYVLTVLSDNNKAGYDDYDATAPAGSGDKIATIGGKDVADDAVIFVFKGEVGTAAATNDGKVITGKDAKSLAKATYTANTMALNSKSSGFTYTKLALIAADTALPEAFDGATYGYLTSDAYVTREGGKTYRNFTIWTGSEEIEVREQSGAGITELLAGVVITYDADGADTVKNVKIPAIETGAVAGWDGNKKIQIKDKDSTEVTSDTTVIYVNSSKKTGVEGGEISIASEPDGEGNGYTNNVRFIEGTDELKLLVVDVNNEMEGAGRTTMAAAATASDIATAFSTYSTVVLGADLSSAQTFTVPAGRTLDISVAQTADHTITVASGATVKVPNGTLIGNTSAVFSSNENITLNTATGGVQLAASAGTVTLNVDATIDDKDSLSLTGTAKLVATEGTKLTVADSKVTATGTNFYTDKADATADAVAASGVYTYTTFQVTSSTPANMVTGWLKNV